MFNEETGERVNGTGGDALWLTRRVIKLSPAQFCLMRPQASHEEGASKGIVPTDSSFHELPTLPLIKTNTIRLFAWRCTYFIHPGALNK